MLVFPLVAVILEKHIKLFPGLSTILFCRSAPCFAWYNARVPICCTHTLLIQKVRTRNYIPYNIAIMALLVLNIVGGAYIFIYSSNKNNSGASVLGSENSAQLVSYVNGDFGFQLSYPGQWNIVSETKNLMWIRPSTYPFDFLNAPQNTDGAPQVAYRLQAFENPKKFGLTEWLSKQKDFPKFDTTARTLPSGLSAVSAITLTPTWKARVTYFVSMSDTVLEVSLFANSVAQAQQEQARFEQSFATLTSVTSAAQASQTYQNGVVGFLIDYPTNFRMSTEDVAKGLVALTAQDGTVSLEVEHGAARASFDNATDFARSRPEFEKFSGGVKPTEVASFEAVVGTFKAEGRDHHYYYVQTTRGYFLLRVKIREKTSLDTAAIERAFLESLRVYEVVATKGWSSYSSGDGLFTFMHSADASIKDVSNGVEVTLGVTPDAPVIGMYKYENFGLSPLEWIDNRQLNKYRAADSDHLLFSVVSRVSGKSALRTADSVGGMKIAVYVNGGDAMYVIDLKPFDSKDTKTLATFNTILDSLKIK